MDVSAFAAQYIETALWSSVGDDADSIKDSHSINDLAPETLQRMASDADAFQTKHATDLACHEDPTMGAHDFWLTRCGHGVGFWDGDWPEPQATRLTKASEIAGNVDLYIGDDGLIYVV